MTNVVQFEKIVNKTRIKNSIFCHFEKIYRKNNNCRVAMTTTYKSTSCNSLGSPLIDGIFLVQKMCIYSCVTLPTTFDYARSACNASTFTSCIYIIYINIYT